MNEMIMLPENIKMLRNKFGFSQEELAKKLNVSNQAISKWESGDSSPSLESLLMLSKIFYTSVDALIIGTNTTENLSENEKNINCELKELYYSFNRKENIGTKLNDIVAKILPLYNYDKDYYWIYSARIILKGTILGILEDSKTNELNCNIKRIKEVLQFSNFNIEDKAEKIKAYFNDKSEKVKEYISILVNSPQATANSIMSLILTYINILSN